MQGSDKTEVVYIFELMERELTVVEKATIDIPKVCAEAVDLVVRTVAVLTF